MNRFVIRLDDGTFVKVSHHKPIFTEDQREAEVWVDQAGAVRWLESKGLGGEVFCIDQPILPLATKQTKASKAEKI